MGLLKIVGRTLAVDAAVLAGPRLGGCRATSDSWRCFGLVVVLLMANAMQNAMVGPDTILLAEFVIGASLLVANAVVARLRLCSPRLRELVEGVPIVLVQHGSWIEENLRRERLTEEEVFGALREHGERADVSHVDLAVLETDGSVSVVPMSAATHRSRRRLRRRRQHGVDGSSPSPSQGRPRPMARSAPAC